MSRVSLAFNPDGTALARLIGDDGSSVEGFSWIVSIIRDEMGFIVRYETIDGHIGELVTTVPSADMSGAHTQATQALVRRARAEGFDVEEAVSPPEGP